MLLGLVRNIRRMVPDASFSVLTIYPRDDRALAADGLDVEIVSCKPAALILRAAPLSLFAPLLNVLRIAGVLRMDPILRTVLDADVVVDAGGITFADGRGLLLAYNVACILPALCLSRPTIKVAQAMGPFNAVLNRSFAGRLLPKLDTILARGKISRGYLDALGLSNVENAADVAFSMPITDESQRIADDIVAGCGSGAEIITVSPSSVVDTYCRDAGLEYVSVLAAFIDRIIAERDCRVLVMAHSVRPDRRVKKNNDVAVCEAVYDAVRQKDHVTLVTADYLPDVHRALIARSRFLIASRFHAMISSLATTVPFIMVGWSHKYEEVAEDFDLGPYCLDYSDLSLDRLLATFEELCAEETQAKKRIAAALPGALEASFKNAEMTVALLRDHSQMQREEAHA